MSKYLELFKESFDDSIIEKMKPENKPYVAYSITEGKVAYTVIPKKEEEDTDTTFRFISREDDNVVDFYSNAWLGNIDDSKKQNIYLKVNNGEWISIANQTSFTLNTGDKLYFKNEGEDLKTFGVNGSSASIGTTTKTFDVAGNVDEFMIPSGNMTDRQYANLFLNTKVMDASKLMLPATTLAEGCYHNMFYGCTSLTTAPKLSATTLAEGCYHNMFYGCTSLTTAPVLPATTLAQYCYNHMFEGCTSLTTAPKLSATTLADYCYSYMFYGCTSLTTAPKLPATTLAGSCYQGMFEGCTSLTTAPELPATELANYCYRDMFKNCNKLNYIKCLATYTMVSGCTNNWVSAVSSTGTFVKHPDMTTWRTGTSGIPSGWDVVNAEV